MGKDQCGSCGFFCLKFNTGEYSEAAAYVRDLNGGIHPVGEHGQKVCCYLAKSSIHEEMAFDWRSNGIVFDL
jgi:hypothetical protein